MQLTLVLINSPRGHTPCAVNVRPVSLMTFIIKVFDIMFKLKITAFPTRNHPTDGSQQGFPSERVHPTQFRSRFNDSLNAVAIDYNPNFVFLTWAEIFSELATAFFFSRNYPMAGHMVDCDDQRTNQLVILTPKWLSTPQTRDHSGKFTMMHNGMSLTPLNYMYNSLSPVEETRAT